MEMFMNKLFLLIIPFILMGCFVSKNDYEKVENENEILRIEIAQLEEELDEIYKEYFSNFRLENTKWQSLDDKRITINFGYNSYTLTRIIGAETGSYKITGDVIVYTINFGIQGEVERKGSLIGDNLSIFNQNFRRIN